MSLINKSDNDKPDDKPDPELERRFSNIQRGLSMAAEGLVLAAKEFMWFQENKKLEFLEERNVTQKQMVIFRRIAGGHVAPSLYLSPFSAKVLEKVAQLDPKEQQELIDGKKIPVMLPGGDTLEVSAYKLNPKQVEQVFADGFIRDEAAQIAWMAEHGQTTHAPPVEIDQPFMVDRKRKKAVFYRECMLSQSQLLDLASQLARL